MAIRELVADANADSDGDLDEEGRLRDEHLEKVFHWASSGKMKADILTKATTPPQRREWMETLNDLQVDLVKPSEVKNRKVKPSKPRAQINVELAKAILAKELQRPV